MTIQLTSYPINAGYSWVFTALITAPDATTIYQGAIAYLIEPLNGDMLQNQAITPITGYVTFALNPTTTANQFTGTATLSSNETTKLLTDAADASLGVNRNKVQLLVTAYTGSATPDPLIDNGDNLKSEDIKVFPAVSKSPSLVAAT